MTMTSVRSMRATIATRPCIPGQDVCVAELGPPVEGDRHLRLGRRRFPEPALLRFGLVEQPAPQPLPPIDPDDIHLICWTVILPASPVVPQADMTTPMEA